MLGVATHKKDKITILIVMLSVSNVEEEME
jgi:hypothetical protein